MRHPRGLLVWLCTCSLTASSFAAVQEPVDYEVVARIKQEAFGRSQVMDMAGIIADVYGPRFSNSPAYNEAIEWARDRLEGFGVATAIEAYGNAGVGWQNEYTSMHMLEPQYMTMIAYPVPWSRATEGRIETTAVFIDGQQIFADSDLSPYLDQVKGRVVFIDPERRLVPDFLPAAERFTSAQLDDWSRFFARPRSDAARMPRREPDRPRRAEDDPSPRPLPTERIAELLDAAGAAALASPGLGTEIGAFDQGTVRVVGGEPLAPDESKPMPHVIVAPEHYNRVVRVLERGLDVEIELEVRVRYDETDLQDYNVVAEIPGSDLAHEIVMIGGHFDAESAGTGATDNGAGSAVVMEVMRILHAIDARPRRTIRGVLWGSEEAGLLGSRGYVKNHFADRESGERLPDYENFSVYFNTDWYGRFRGIFTGGNAAAAAIFSEWMKPFHELGLAHTIPVQTGGTDSVSFNEVGLPGFKFLQDDLEYFTKTWHSNMDVYDRLVAEDLMGNAAILATFAYHAAMRDEKIPRNDHPAINGRPWEQ